MNSQYIYVRVRCNTAVVGDDVQGVAGGARQGEVGQPDVRAVLATQHSVRPQVPVDDSYRRRRQVFVLCCKLHI